MAVITLRPDLRTAGGEVTELLLDGKFVGTIALVYREAGRLSGSVQLHSDLLLGRSKEEVIAAAQQYVDDLTEAVGAWDCEVFVTCSDYDRVITTGELVDIDEDDDLENAGLDADWPDARAYTIIEDDDVLDDIDPDELDRMEMETSDSGAERIDRLAGLFELAIVGESRNRIEYHVYDRDKEWVAEVFVRLSGSDVMAEVDWKAVPSDEESEAIADLLVSDFDPEEIDTFWIEMIVDGEVVETIELTHEDLLDDDEAHLYSKGFAVRLVRNDGDTLTYELFDKERGEVPIGQATIDLGSDDMTGFIDFSDSFSSEDRELIGSLLSMELDKERDYDSLNLTMLHNNVPIDEIWFESETFH